MPLKWPSFIPWTFKISISGRQLYRRFDWLKPETTQEFWQIKTNIFISLLREKKSPFLIIPYSSKIKLCSAKAKKVSKIFKICKPKFYCLISKDKAFNPYQTNATQAWPIPSCLQKVPMNPSAHWKVHSQPHSPQGNCLQKKYSYIK